MSKWRTLVEWLLGKKSPMDKSVTQISNPIEITLAHYASNLKLPLQDTQILENLLARDAVAATLQQVKSPRSDQIQQLADLDVQLRERLADFKLDTVARWRKTLDPPSSAWWWFPEILADERGKNQDLLWFLVSGSLITLSAALTLDIIKRLWNGAPDTYSVIGTLLTLLLTASPLTKQGQELGNVLIRRMNWIKPRWRAKAMLGSSLAAFALVLFGWFLLPSLAQAYNNWGIAALQSGNVLAAQQDFQRAVALSPDLVVPYQNIADQYEQIGLYDDAAAWYQKAIARDQHF